ncbi:midasin-like [Glossina fuscipes fuscipes]
MCYKSDATITVDEQLFPTKARCRFTECMPNKPNKFGIKLWLASDVKERGRLSVLSFGERPQTLLNRTEQFDRAKLVNLLNFSQDKTKIAELLDFIRVIIAEECCTNSDNGIFENLLLIFSEGKTKVKNSIELARLQGVFLLYIIIDNPENKNSILDIQTMEMLPDKKINIKSYLDDFPYPYYAIVRDLNQLPLVLSEAMRQWFELVNQFN